MNHVGRVFAGTLTLSANTIPMDLYAQYVFCCVMMSVRPPDMLLLIYILLVKRLVRAGRNGTVQYGMCGL